jgi:hypothetical protein
MAAVLAVFISSVQKEYEADRQRAADRRNPAS